MVLTRLVAALALVATSAAYAPGTAAARLRAPPAALRRAAPVLQAPKEEQDLEQVTEKFGLEAGLFSALKKGTSGNEEEKKGSMAQAGDLLKRYGGAYLLTSTSLAIVSFSLCYWAIDNGVDVQSLLQRVGIEVSETSETVGTVGIAYAIHKAASPIRFPPTVALTPVVAKTLFGKTDDDDEASED